MGHELMSVESDAPAGAGAGTELPERIAARRVLGARLGHDFGDPELFDQALRHRSWCSVHPGTLSNERLEFLGDAVVGLAVAGMVSRTLPEVDEGVLAALRGHVVSATVLAERALQLGVGEALYLDTGEERSGGRTKRTVLCDAFEALIGAVYLDDGVDAGIAVVEALLGETVEAVCRAGLEQHLDAKSKLQELTQRLVGAAPEYRVYQAGPDHSPEFSAEVVIAETTWGRGQGSSKKAATLAAAHDALGAGVEAALSAQRDA